MKYMTLTIILAVVLSGCGAASDFGSKLADAYPLENPKLVFSPGHKMKVGEQIVPVFGNAECPSADRAMRMLFGPNSDEGQINCIVIAPDTKEVFVTVGLSQGPSREVWTVERSGKRNERVALRRPDGTYIAAAS